MTRVFTHTELNLLMGLCCLIANRKSIALALANELLNMLSLINLEQ